MKIQMLEKRHCRAWTACGTSMDVVIDNTEQRWSLHIVPVNGGFESFAYFSDRSGESNLGAFCRAEIRSKEAAERLADEFLRVYNG